MKKKGEKCRKLLKGIQKSRNPDKNLVKVYSKSHKNHSKSSKFDKNVSKIRKIDRKMSKKSKNRNKRRKKWLKIIENQ